jgi:diacylglycerol kinase family enzyme
MADKDAEAAVERIFATLEPVEDADRRRALVIVNPFATTVSARLRNLVVHALSARYRVDAVDTQRRGHASELAREAAAEGYDVVIAFGGDGTVNEAANGLAGSDTPLTCLPGGSANVFCKLLGIPAEIVDATEHLLAVADRFAPRFIDLGAVEGRLYTFSAGVGIDAHVVRTVDARPRLKARFGPYFYLAAAVAAPRMFVSAGGESVAGVTAVIQNAEHYTYWRQRPLDLAAGATLDGGTLSAVVLARASVLGAATLGVRALAGRGGVGGHRQIRALPASTAITVSSSTGRPLPLQVDGDYIGEVTEARFTIRPQALAVVA